MNLARDKRTGKMVALKAVNIMKILELNKERHILREKELTIKLKHPNIVKLYNTFKVGKYNYSNKFH